MSRPASTTLCAIIAATAVSSAASAVTVCDHLLLDANRDGAVNIADVSVAGAAINSGATAGDYNADGATNIADLVVFTHLYSAGSTLKWTDFDLDGDTDSDDFNIFFALWTSGSMRADITGDGVLDFNDIFAQSACGL